MYLLDSSASLLRTSVKMLPSYCVEALGSHTPAQYLWALYAQMATAFKAVTQLILC